LDIRAPEEIRANQCGNIPGQIRGPQTACFSRAGVETPGSSHLQTRAIAVVPGRRDMQAKVGIQFDFCDPLQRLAQNASFKFQLSLVGNVLVMASAALAKYGQRASMRSGDASISCVTSLARSQASLAVSRPRLFRPQHKRHKDRHAAPVRSDWRAGEAVAAVDHFFYGKQQVVSVARVLCILTREFVWVWQRYLCSELEEQTILVHIEQTQPRHAAPLQQPLSHVLFV